MKRRFLQFISLAICIGALWSCGEDENNPVTSTNLEGTWDLRSVDYDGIYSIYQDEELYNTWDISGVGTDIDMKFNFSGNKVNVTGSYSMNIQNELFPEMPILIPVEGSVYSGTYEVDGNKIHFHNEEGIETAEIISQTDSQLVMKMLTSSTNSSDGIDYVFKIDANFVLTK